MKYNGRLKLRKVGKEGKREKVVEHNSKETEIPLIENMTPKQLSLMFQILATKIKMYKKI